MKFNSKKRVMLFNSKKSKPEAKKSFLTLLAYRGHNFFKEDPEQSLVPEAAENAANHYLHGCHHACDENSTCKGGKKPCVSHCDSNCGGSYIDQSADLLKVQPADYDEWYPKLREHSTHEEAEEAIKKLHNTPIFIGSSPHPDGESPIHIYDEMRSEGIYNNGPFDHKTALGEALNLQEIDDKLQDSLQRRKDKLEPSQDAQNLFGLRRAGSKWFYDKDRSSIRNYLSLTDALKLKIRNKSFGDTGTIEERFNTPSREIGFSDKGDKIATGQYQTTDKNGNTKSYFAHPSLDLKIVAELRDGFFHSALRRGGSTADAIKAHEQTMAFAHGIEDTKPDGTKKWRHLSEGAKPFMLQKSIKGVLSNIFKHSEYDGDERLRPAYDKAKTAEWVMCACPHCAHVEAMNPENSIFDIQDHNKAATHKEKSISDAYYSGFVMGAGGHLGEGNNSRVSFRLGNWGSRTPHRGLYMKKSILRYMNSIIRGRNEEQDKRYAGHDFAIPIDVAPIDTTSLKQKAERQDRTDIATDYGSD
jgi:hypothetical protein